MPGIKLLNDVYAQKGDTFLKNMLNGYVIVNKQLNGSYFGVSLPDKSGQWNFLKKDTPISKIDRILMKYYDAPISHFENLGRDVMEKVPDSYLFGTEYTVYNEDTEEGEVKVPEITLTHIYDSKNDKYIHNKSVLDVWAKVLNINKPPIIFEGKLSDEQKTKILDFVYTPFNELLDKFKVNSFTQYILSILNPDNTDITDINSVVFRFYEDDQESGEAMVAKMIDPIFQEMTKQNDKQVSKPNDYVYLIIIDLMNFIEMYRLQDLKTLMDNGKSFEENYVILINKIYLDFIKKYYNKYIDIRVDVPDFMQNKQFDINIEQIDNKEIVGIIQLSDTFKEIYKILLNFFRKKRKRPHGIFDRNILLQFNNLVDKIKKIIIGNNIYESHFPSFYEFTGSILEDFEYFNSLNIKDQFNRHKRMSRVNIIIDRFQPITMDHMEAARMMHKKNRLPTVFMALNVPNRSVSPFDSFVTGRLLNAVKADNPLIVRDVVYITNDTIENILSTLYPMYIPVMWSAVKNKVDDYVLQLDYIKKRKMMYNLDKKFKLVPLPMDANANRALDAIKTGNFDMYKQLTPPAIHSEFFNLKQELGGR